MRRGYELDEATGLPIEGATVEAFDEAGRQIGVTQTDEAGYWALFGPAARVRITSLRKVPQTRWFVHYAPPRPLTDHEKLKQLLREAKV